MSKAKVNPNQTGSSAAAELVNIASTSSNPFDLSKLKLSQDFDGLGGGVKKLVTTIPVKKPNKQAFIRAVGGPDYQMSVAVIELKGEQDGPYIVVPELADELAEEISLVRLVTCVDRAGNLFLWPLKLAKSGERSNPWHESALLALGHAEKTWVRISPNMTAGHYDVFQAVAALPSPSTPELTFQQIVEIAFRGKLINSPDHPVLKKLRGEE